MDYNVTVSYSSGKLSIHLTGEHRLLLMERRLLRLRVTSPVGNSDFMEALRQG